MPLLLLALACSTPADSSPGHRPPKGDTAVDTGAPGDDSAHDTGRDTGDTVTTDSGPPDTADSRPQDSGTGGAGGALGTSAGTIGTSTWTAYAPPCMADARAVAVVYTFHGTGGTGAQMVGQWQGLADRECFLVVGLDSEDGQGWNFNSDVRNLGSLLDSVDAAWNVNRRYMHGYSAGAHWTYVIALANASYFAGFGVYAGSMRYAEQYGSWPTDAEPIPVAIAHGTEDTTVPYREATSALAELTDAGWPANLDTYEGSTHAYEQACEAVAWAWWQSELRIAEAP